MKYYNSAKLTVEAVHRVLKRLAAGEKQKDIARDENVCEATITFIKQGRTYRKIKRVKNPLY